MNKLSGNISQKLLTNEEAEQLFSEEWRSEKTVVFTNGCFDIFHPGHHHLLTQAKALGDILVIGLNADESVQRLKGSERPVNKENKRASLLAEKEYVDYVILFQEDTPLKLIQIVRPNILVKGGDYIEKEIVGYEFVTSYGGKVKTIPLLKGFSTTKLIEKQKKQ